MSITAADCPSPADVPLRGLKRDFAKTDKPSTLLKPGKGPRCHRGAPSAA